MRQFSAKSILIVFWLAWCAWWFADGLCTFAPECAGLLKPVHIGERRMTDLLVLMLSGFPAGTYTGGFLGDFVVGADKPINGFFGYLVQSLVVVAIGYLQWFVLLPWLWRQWKARKFLKST